MQKKKGISLIVLVITIIVMIILAAAIILSLNNAGIINKANQAVQETDLAQVKHLATLAWSDAYLDGKTKQVDLKAAVDEALKGIDTSKYTITVTEKGVDVALKGEGNQGSSTEHNGVIPEGGTYYVGVTSDQLGNYDGATATYTAGDEFPAEVNTGDVYVYDGYEYRFNSLYTDSKEGDLYWKEAVQLDGWSVMLIDNSQIPQGILLGNVNDKKLLDMNRTFEGCTSLTTLESLTIPSSVTNLGCTFKGCTGLTTLDGLTIPNSVTDMNRTFEGCTSLTTLEGLTIPNGVTDMNATFEKCTSLATTGGLVIPSGVKYLQHTFYNCTSLTGSIEINAILELSYTPDGYSFEDCLYNTQITEITGTTNAKSQLLESKTGTPGENS